LLPSAAQLVEKYKIKKEGEIARSEAKGNERARVVENYRHIDPNFRPRCGYFCERTFFGGELEL
jgi:hypothetical protein